MHLRSRPDADRVVHWLLRPKCWKRGSFSPSRSRTIQSIQLPSTANLLRLPPGTSTVPAASITSFGIPGPPGNARNLSQIEVNRFLNRLHDVCRSPNPRLGFSENSEPAVLVTGVSRAGYVSNEFPSRRLKLLDILCHFRLCLRRKSSSIPVGNAPNALDATQRISTA